jgi:hypothetical protein
MSKLPKAAKRDLRKISAALPADDKQLLRVLMRQQVAETSGNRTEEEDALAFFADTLEVS